MSCPTPPVGTQHPSVWVRLGTVHRFIALLGDTVCVNIWPMHIEVIATLLMVENVLGVLFSAFNTAWSGGSWRAWLYANNIACSSYAPEL